MARQIEMCADNCLWMEIQLIRFLYRI
uniref:Uncharacterized protein n=1 Tax=Arundo donax TaxID=35708 RepID=A0A0A9BAS5_ARUDO